MLGTLADSQRGISAANREGDQRLEDSISISIAFALVGIAAGGAVRFRRECPS
jgi:hypothetical protein